MSRRGAPDHELGTLAQVIKRTKSTLFDLANANNGLIGCSGVSEMIVFKLSCARNGTYMSGSGAFRLKSWTDLGGGRTGAAVDARLDDGEQVRDVDERRTGLFRHGDAVQSACVSLTVLSLRCRSWYRCNLRYRRHADLRLVHHACTLDPTPGD